MSVQPKEPDTLNQMYFYMSQLQYQADFESYNGSNVGANRIMQDDLNCSKYLNQLEDSSNKEDNEMGATAMECMNDSYSTQAFKNIDDAAQTGSVTAVGNAMGELSYNERWVYCPAAFLAFNEAYKT